MMIIQLKKLICGILEIRLSEKRINLPRSPLCPGFINTSPSPTFDSGRRIKSLWCVVNGPTRHPGARSYSRPAGSPGLAGSRRFPAPASDGCLVRCTTAQWRIQGGGHRGPCPPPPNDGQNFFHT